MNTERQTSDVAKDEIAILDAQRHQWLDCLYGDDPNSIGFQVYVLLDNLRSWWTINKARHFAPRDENGDVKGFASLHGLLNRCFATSQKAAIRRLCDSGSIDHEKRGVWSLGSLLVDLKNNASLLTRGAVLTAEGLRVDLKSLERENDRAVRSFEVGPMDELARSRCRHEDMDLLAGKTSSDRSVHDQMRPEVFEAMQAFLDSTCKEICEKVNKFVAHAGTPESRKELIDDSSQVTPNELLQSAIAINSTFQFITSVVLPRPACQGAPVPRGCKRISSVELFDALEHMACPLVLTKDVPRVRCIRDEMTARLSERDDPKRFLASLGIF